MNVFVQGMRRSGTTIVFDLFCEDPRFDTYYEPLAAANRRAVGGGSEIRQVDFFDKIRACRMAFMQGCQQVGSPDLLNYGAPRDPELELETDLPGYCRDYIRYLLSQAQDTVIKFTRAYCKVRVLAELDPNAKFVHVVRDPRALTTSYLFGKGRKNAHRFPTEDSFFRSVSQRTAWSSYPLSEHILRTPEYEHLQGCEDFFRILVLWKYTFRKTREAALACFGDDYFLLKHEALVADPIPTLDALQQFLSQPQASRVRAWAMAHVRPGPEPYAADSSKWREAFRRLDLEEDLAAAGYEC